MTVKKHVLVVDDEVDIRNTVGQILTISGYDVVAVENGAQCLAQLAVQRPDLVVLDIMMPGMSGWDVAARMKGTPAYSSIPIIFLTAKGDEMSRGLGGLASQDYIVKPFDIATLKASVDRILCPPATV